MKSLRFPSGFSDKDIELDKLRQNNLDLTKKITELEAAESKFSREVDSLKNSMGERKGELKLKKEEWVDLIIMIY